MTTHWTKKQQQRYAALMRKAARKPEECWLGYWCSDAHGYPVPGSGATRTVRAFPGAVHEISATVPRACSTSGLHATLDPVCWPGHRVWAVAIHGPRHEEWGKVAGLRREVIGEVWPDEALDERLGARLGRRDLRGAYLRGANLPGAYLLGANLRGADLRGADLRGANLRCAYLQGANLQGANLQGANLQNADLQNADLQNADLVAAELEGAYLRGANLQGADLQGADLQRADLWVANLHGANLQRADLQRADLQDANLHGVYRFHEDSNIPRWKNVNGRLERE